MAFYVYGDYGLETQCELEVFKTAERAQQFINGYTKYYGDMGGYQTLDIISFTADGDFISLHQMRSDDRDLGWDWQDDYALEEDF